MMIFSLVAMTGLEKCCITSAYLLWLCHSGEWPVGLLLNFLVQGITPKTIQGILLKFHKMIKDIKREVQNSRTIKLPCLLFALFPFIKFSCPGHHNFETIQGILLQLHKMIKDIQRDCSVQEP